MEKKRKFEEDIESIDKKLIMVSPTPRGHYTLLDGNKRSVALQSINALVGTKVFLGVSETVTKSRWVRAKLESRSRA